MSKRVNLRVEEDATFSKLLTLTNEHAIPKGINPVTQLEEFTLVKEPIDLTGYAIKAQIRSSFEGTVIQEFTSSILDAKTGKAYISLSRVDTARLDSYVNWSRNLGVDTERVGFLGYYDVLLIKEGKATRILQGTVQLSRSVTKEFTVASTDNYAIVRSPTLPIVQDLELDIVSKYPHCFLGIEYFSNDGTSVTPTQGLMYIYRMPSTANVYQTAPIGVLAAQSPQGELAWKGNTSKIKVVPDSISGADSYRVAVVCNKS